MDPFKAFGDHGFDAQQCCAFGRPIARAACTVLFAAKDHQRCSCALVRHSRIKDRGLCPVGSFGVAAFDAIQHFVLDPDVGKGAPHHDLVVAATRSIRVEFARCDLAVHQVLACGCAFFERACGADVVSGDHVTKDGQHFGIDDVADRARLCAHPLEVGWVLHVGRGWRPVIGQRIRGFHALPFFVAFEDVGIFGQERFARDGRFDQFCDFGACGPDVFQEDVIAVLVLTDRILGQVDVQGAGKCVSHNQRGRGKVVGAHVRADPPFEVAVA